MNISYRLILLWYFMLRFFLEVEEPTLKNVLPFPLGAAVKVDRLRRDSDYANSLIREFNSITPENAMKFKILHPGKNTYKWDDADYLVSFALKNNMRIHGHTLNWAKDKTYPYWVTHFQGDSAAWEGLLKSHIQTVVSHFKGKVGSWDVVNEAFNDDGSYKKTFWILKLGPGYIARSFKYAHKADPSALLFYNDYGHEYGGKKLRAIIQMTERFKRDLVPISGLGMQMHTNIRIGDNKIEDAIQTVAATGLKVHISELEVSVKYKMPASFLMTDSQAILQAKQFKIIFDAYVKIPVSQQFGITTWAVSDKDSFRNSKIKNHDHPTLLNIRYQPKAAYNAVLSSFRDK